MVANGSREFYDDDKNLMKLCDFLRSTEGPPVREAVEMDKRVYYIKGACYRGATFGGQINLGVVQVKSHTPLIRPEHRRKAGEFHGRAKERNKVAEGATQI